MDLTSTAPAFGKKDLVKGLWAWMKAGVFGYPVLNATIAITGVGATMSGSTVVASATTLTRLPEDRLPFSAKLEALFSV